MPSGHDSDCSRGPCRSNMRTCRNGKEPSKPDCIINLKIPMKRTSPLMTSWPKPPSVNQSQVAGPTKALHRTMFLALLTVLLSLWQVRATGFVESFEKYAQGAIDSNFVGGPNQADNGGTNAWFGAASPNFVATTNEF